MRGLFPGLRVRFYISIGLTRLLYYVMPDKLQGSGPMNIVHGDHDHVDRRPKGTINMIGPHLMGLRGSIMMSLCRWQWRQKWQR